MRILKGFATAVALAGGLGVMVANPGTAKADLCASTTSCILTFTQGNASSGFGVNSNPGGFGTVDLELNTSTHVVTVNLAMASGFFLIGTGFPGTVGFSGLGGNLTISNFTSGAYSGFISDAAQDQHFDGFGVFNDVAATTAPSAGSGSKVNALSFDVTGTAGHTITDVEQLVNLSNIPPGDMEVYFVADVFNSNTTGAGAGKTGLVAVTGGGSNPTCPPGSTGTFPNCFPQPPVPEPASLLILGSGLFGIGAALRRRYTHS